MWLSIWFITWNVLCVLKKNIYSAAVAWNVLYISFGLFWSIVFFRSSFSLLHFCMYHLSNIETEVPYTVIVLLFLPSILLLFALNIRCSNIGCIYTCDNWPLYQYIVTFFVSCDWFCLKVYYMWYNCCYSCSLLVTICMEYLLPSFQLICVLGSKVSLKWVSCRQHVVGFFFIHLPVPVF